MSASFSCDKDNLKYLVCVNEKFGKYAKAKKFLKKGELILSDDALFIVPSRLDPPCCLNCFDDFHNICRFCQIYPLCRECISHDLQECLFLQQQTNIDKDFLINNFAIATPLKCILSLLNGKTKEKFDILMNMESHLQHRKNTDIWKEINTELVKPMLDLNIFNETNFSFIVNEELIQKICGIFDVNSFEIRGPKDLNGIISECRLRGIYPTAATLPHSCTSNTMMTVDSKYRMNIYASVDIEENEIISINYTGVLFNTTDRQDYLRKGKYFDCDCQRCLDPSELGTHLSSITCISCKNGLCIPPTSNPKRKWRCQNCFSEIDQSEVEKLLDEARNELRTSNASLILLEEMNSKYSLLLNPNHSYVIEIKQAIAATLRDIIATSNNNSSFDLLNRKIQICQEILSVLRIVQPGLSRLTGIGLYELYQPYVQLAQLNYENKTITLSGLLEKLEDGEKILKESISMLVYEHIDVPEGKLARHAIGELKELRNAINGVKITMKK